MGAVHKGAMSCKGGIQRAGWAWGIRTENTPKVRFSAMIGEEPEVELRLV